MYKKKKTKQDPSADDFPPTCIIFPATWSFNDNPVEY